jgi:molybdopterin-binding protein
MRYARVDITEVAMKLSARNVLKGRVLGIDKGSVTSHVQLDIGGMTITSSITNEAVEELGLKIGIDAYAVIKASDVMVAVD